MKNEQKYEDLENQVAELKKQNEILRLNSIYQNEENEKRTDELRKTTVKHKDFAKNSPYIIYKYSNKSGGLFYSERVQYILGYSPNELVDNPFFWNNSIHPNDRVNVKGAIENNKKGADHNIEYRIKTKQGKWIWLQDSFMHKNQIGDEIIIEGHATDITVRKEAELALIDSELRWKFAIEGNSDGLWDWNLITNEVFYSDQWKKMLGFEIEEIEADLKEWDKRVHPDDKKKVYEDINKHINGEVDFYANEHRVLCKDNTYKWILDRGKIISFTWDNKPERMIGMHTDISKRKKTEQSLAESETKLRELNATKDKFFSIIAHDLRNPFNAIIGLSEILLSKHKEYDDEHRERIIEMANSSAKNAFTLLENLLAWARSQSGNIFYSPKKINFKALLTKTLIDLQAQITQKNIHLLDETQRNETIMADENMISSVLRNLISNAIKFTPHSGTILISSKKNDDINFLEVSITDTGVGIPKDKIDDLFHIDKNTSTLGTENETGTGLGLILCKEFVEKHGGKIWIESEKGRGSIFKFTLPLGIE